MACSEKSNASYKAIDSALELVKETGNLAVPLDLRNAPTELLKELGHGKNYQYAHSHENNFTKMEFLPNEIKGYRIFEPGDNSKELQLRKFLKANWKEKYGY